jgi:hypothetical protein
MRLAHPLAGLTTVVPDVLRRSQYAGQPLRLFAFVEGEPLGSPLPRGLRDDLEFMGARRTTVCIKPGRESLQGAFRKAGGYSRFELLNCADRSSQSENFSDRRRSNHQVLPWDQCS